MFSGRVGGRLRNLGSFHGVTIGPLITEEGEEGGGSGEEGGEVDASGDVDGSDGEEMSTRAILVGSPC